MTIVLMLHWRCEAVEKMLELSSNVELLSSRSCSCDSLPGYGGRAAEGKAEGSSRHCVLYD